MVARDKRGVRAETREGVEGRVVAPGGRERTDWFDAGGFGSVASGLRGDSFGGFGLRGDWLGCGRFGGRRRGGRFEGIVTALPCIRQDKSSQQQSGPEKDTADECGESAMCGETVRWAGVSCGGPGVDPDCWHRLSPARGFLRCGGLPPRAGLYAVWEIRAR